MWSEVGILSKCRYKCHARLVEVEVGGKKECSARRTNEFRQKLLKLINCIKSLGLLLFLPPLSHDSFGLWNSSVDYLLCTRHRLTFAPSSIAFHTVGPTEYRISTLATHQPHYLPFFQLLLNWVGSETNVFTCRKSKSNVLVRFRRPGRREKSVGAWINRSVSAQRPLHVWFHPPTADRVSLHHCSRY